MRARLVVMSLAVTAAGAMMTAQAPKRFNPMVELLAAKKPVFGLYAPSNRRFGGGPGGAPGAHRVPPPLSHGGQAGRRAAGQRRTLNSRRKRSNSRTAISSSTAAWKATSIARCRRLRS